MLGIGSLTGTVYAGEPEGSRGLACWRCGRLFGVLRPDGEFVAHNPVPEAVSD